MDYSANEGETIHTLLVSWGLLELLPECRKMKIDAECFQYMTEDDLKILVPDCKLGLRIKLRQRLKEWKSGKSEGMLHITEHFPQRNTMHNVEIPRKSLLIPMTNPPTAMMKQDVDGNHAEEESIAGSADESYTEDDPLHDIDTKLNIHLTEDFLAQSSYHSYCSPSNETFSLDEVLNTFKGRDVIAFYNNHQKFDSAHRKNLVDAIATYFIDREIRISSVQYETISSEIVKRFPTERKETYYEKIHGQPPLGKLLHRYNNLRKIQRVSTIKRKNPQSRNNKQDSSKKPNIIKKTDDIVFTEAKEMLRTNFEPWEKLLDVWKIWAEKRVNDFRNITGFNDLNVILEMWPAITKPLGYKLIEIDFDTLHPHKSNMISERWTTFLVKFMEICSREIRDSASKQLLNDLVNEKDIPDDAFNCIVALILGSVLRQFRMLKKNDGTVWRPSISECQRSFVIHVQNINDYEQAIEDYKWKCEACQVSVNPVILAIGQDIKSVDQFYVHFEKFNYRFDNFLQAFSVCFKMYSVLNLQFLRPSESMWSFVEQYFFDIPDGNNYVRSTVLSVFLNDMRN